MDGAVLERLLPDEHATAMLGQDLALAVRPGDVLALKGDLGAGKTTLARALIRALADDPELDVPSPTFILVQAYATRVPILHVDLYRIGSADELDELGLEEALQGGAVLVEWPERAAGRLPGDAVTVELSHSGEGRLARLSGPGAALDRIARSFDIRDFLASAGWGRAERVHLTGDASARSYETVSMPGETARVLMNSPPLVLGPPVRDGKPYAVIAHTARTVNAFVAIAGALGRAGVSVPAIHARDLDRGLLLIEHLGSGSFLDESGNPVAGRYEAAAELLAMIHGRAWPERMAVAPGIAHDVPPFDREAMMIEADLLPAWYVPHCSGAPASAAFRADFEAVWNRILDRLDRAEKSLVLRDFHSPNIIWRGDRQGHDRLGIVDFQDALIGPAAYDVASLAMDARVSVPPAIQARIVDAYVAAREAAGPFDVEAFREACAIMAAQRNSKILGIFVRLDLRDGKPQYIKHLPRIRAYLRRALVHPALSELRALYEAGGLLAEPAA